MKKAEKKAKRTKKVEVKDLEIRKIKGGMEAEADPKGGPFDVFLKGDNIRDKHQDFRGKLVVEPRGKIDFIKGQGGR